MKLKLSLLFPWIVLLFVIFSIFLDRRMTREVQEIDSGVARFGMPSQMKEGEFLDPICQMSVGREAGSISWTYEGKSYFFCSDFCKESFKKAPEEAGNGSKKSLVGQEQEQRGISRDPVCQMDIATSNAYALQYEQKRYYFCTAYCLEAFKKNPDEWLNREVLAETHTMHGIPSWMYQWSIALILLISFGFFELVNLFKEKRGLLNEGGASLSARWKLTTWKPLYRVLQWPPLIFLLRSVMVFFFLGILFAGLFGNQNPAMNIAPLLTWTIWWVGLVFVIMYLGKAWCTVCPWDAIATWMERLKFWGVRKEGLGLQLKWPLFLRNIWLAVFLFLGLTWIELCMGITSIPRATAYLGLGMLGMSILCALIFERKSFCRYACLVGRVSGLYALFSSIELRAMNPSACETCKTMDCYRGNEKGDGCPTFEFPRMMKTNTYCILCTECIKTCPKENIVIQQRPWGADLVQKGKPRVDEAFLSIILLSMTGFHGLTMTPKWAEWSHFVESFFQISYRLAFSLLMLVILIAPFFVFWGLTQLASLASKEHSSKTFFIRYAYALLPIALFYHLAHNAEHFLMEGPKVVALISDPCGWVWNLFGTARWTMTPLITLEGLWGIQVIFVLIGHLYSLWISERITRQLVSDRRKAFISQLPLLGAMVLFSFFSLWLLKQPMEMRISAM